MTQNCFGARDRRRHNECQRDIVPESWSWRASVRPWRPSWRRPDRRPPRRRSGFAGAARGGVVGLVLPVLGKELLTPPAGFRRAAAELRNRFGGEDCMHVHEAFPPCSGGTAGERTSGGRWDTRTPLRQ
jgi:hypothetical protein